MLTKNKSKVSISDEAAALHEDTESLPACTLWVGGIPSSAANLASITQACEGIAGPKCVSRVTVRVKPSDVARTHKVPLRHTLCLRRVDRTLLSWANNVKSFRTVRSPGRLSR